MKEGSTGRIPTRAIIEIRATNSAEISLVIIQTIDKTNANTYENKQKRKDNV